jgi:hypothetical protein
LAEAEPVEQPLHAVRERLVGEILVGEQRVAADRRHLARDQHGRHRRDVEIRGVRVPDAAEVDLLVLELGDGDDFRKAVEPLEERVFDRLTEPLRQREEPRRRKILIAEEHDASVEPDAADFRDCRVVEVAREVDAGNLRPERARDPVHLETPRGGREHGD